MLKFRKNVAALNCNDRIFSKMSLLIINIDNPILLIMISSLLSGIIGILSGWAGTEFKKARALPAAKLISALVSEMVIARNKGA